MVEYRDIRFLEGLPAPGLDDLGPDVVSLMRRIGRCGSSGIAQMTSSRKNGLGWSGLGFGQFDEGFDTEM